MVSDQGPPVRSQHDHRDLPAAQVLLVLDVLIRSDKNVKT
jgi:hypothetical protein